MVSPYYWRLFKKIQGKIPKRSSPLSCGIFDRVVKMVCLSNWSFAAAFCPPPLSLLLPNPSPVLQKIVLTLVLLPLLLALSVQLVHCTSCASLSSSPTSCSHCGAEARTHWQAPQRAARGARRCGARRWAADTWGTLSPTRRHEAK